MTGDVSEVRRVIEGALKWSPEMALELVRDLLEGALLTHPDETKELAREVCGLGYRGEAGLCVSLPEGGNAVVDGVTYTGEGMGMLYPGNELQMGSARVRVLRHEGKGGDDDVDGVLWTLEVLES